MLFFSWVWIIQDIMGISLSIYLISNVHFTSFKSITFLLVAFIVFDVLKMNLSLTITQVDILKCSVFKEILRTTNGYFFLILELKFCWNGNKWCKNCTLYRGNYSRLINRKRISNYKGVSVNLGEITYIISFVFVLCPLSFWSHRHQRSLTKSHRDPLFPTNISLNMSLMDHVRLRWGTLMTMASKR
jgi:hypothetical protein